jgi:hypothetical protein
VFLVAASVLVEFVTVALFLSDYSRWWLLAVYFGQAFAYVQLGQLMLGRNDQFYYPY